MSAEIGHSENQLSNLGQMAVIAKDLKFQYDFKKELVINIPKFEVPRGKSLFLYGPSGSGKTTLLGLLALIQSPTHGFLSILDQNVKDIPVERRDQFRGAHIGYIFQVLNLIPFLSVLENILLPIRLNQSRKTRLPENCDPREIANKISKHLSIDSILNKMAGEISVGQQQRVAAARALVGCPEIIIADEPTSSLDYEARDKFIELLLEESKLGSSTVIFVSHDHSLKKHFEQAYDLRDLNKAVSSARVSK